MGSWSSGVCTIKTCTCDGGTGLESLGQFTQAATGKRKVLWTSKKSLWNRGDKKREQKNRRVHRDLVRAKFGRKRCMIMQETVPFYLRLDLLLCTPGNKKHVWTNKEKTCLCSMREQCRKHVLVELYIQLLTRTRWTEKTQWHCRCANWHFLLFVCVTREDMQRSKGDRWTKNEGFPRICQQADVVGVQ